MARLSPLPDRPSEVAGAFGDGGWSELSFEALGTSVRIAVRGGGPGLLIDARQMVDDLDRKWNPRRPDSLVAQLEAATGAPVPLDDDTFALVEDSLAAAAETEGAVGSEGLGLNAVLTRVTVAPDAVVDLDDLARARAADQVAEALIEAGADGAMVDVGDTLRLAGTVAEGGSWPIEITDPDDPGVVRATLRIVEGASATVTRPQAALATVTVLAPTAGAAVVPAAAADREHLEGGGLPALVIDDDGTLHRIGDIDAFVVRARP